MALSPLENLQLFQRREYFAKFREQNGPFLFPCRNGRRSGVCLGTQGHNYLGETRGGGYWMMETPRSKCLIYVSNFDEYDSSYAT